MWNFSPVSFKRSVTVPSSPMYLMCFLFWSLSLISSIEHHYYQSDCWYFYYRFPDTSLFFFCFFLHLATSMFLSFDVKVAVYWYGVWIDHVSNLTSTFPNFKFLFFLSFFLVYSCIFNFISVFTTIYPLFFFSCSDYFELSPFLVAISICFLSYFCCFFSYKYQFVIHQSLSI